MLSYVTKKTLLIISVIEKVIQQEKDALIDTGCYTTDVRSVVITKTTNPN